MASGGSDKTWFGMTHQAEEKYEIRYKKKYGSRYVRPLTKKENEIIKALGTRDKDQIRKACLGPNADIPLAKGQYRPRYERKLVWEELHLPNNGNKKRQQYGFMDLIRCNGRTSTLAARRKKEKPKPKFRSYAQARKDREKFRQKLVEIIMHRDEWDDEDAEPAGPAAPLTTKEKDMLRYYYYIHNGIDTRFVAGINSRWFKRIMTMVPKRLQKNQKEIKRIQDEIKEDYLFAVKKSIVDFVLKEPEIDEDERFLDEDDETPMTIELAGVSNAWRKLYKQSKKHLKFNLFTVNPCMLQTMILWYKTFQNTRFVDAAKMKDGPKLELMAYQDTIYQNVERVKSYLKDQWLEGVHEIYRMCLKKKHLPAEHKRAGFLRTLFVQMTNQIQGMTLESMTDFDNFVRGLNEGDSQKQRAGFILSLKAVNGKITFYPAFKDVENAIIETYDIIVKASRDIPRFENVLERNEDNEEDAKPKCLRPIILQQILDQMKDSVKLVVQEQKKYPEDYIKEYDKFIYLIDGRAETDVDAYIKEDHDFEELSEKVKFFDDLSSTFMTTMPKEVNLGMFELHCEDITQNLNRKTTILRERVLKKMSADHQNENKKLCVEFEDISSTALSSPSNTEELVMLKEKVAHIRSVVMKQKEAELNLAAKRLVFLSDYLQFTTAEMKLNTKTFQWHAKMPKVFDEHEKIVQEKTKEYQKALKLRRDRFIEELEASNLQVDDFYTYGNVDDLPKYMKKAQTLSSKLALCKERIQQFNMEEEAFQWEKTNYPLWQATVDKLQPFLGLYETAMAFMNKQKTWFESPMGTHDPQDIENEVNSSWELVSRLESEFSDIPAARELVINVREKIEEFRSKMPVIRTLGNPGFRDRHWENVSNTVGFPVKGGFNLFQILDMGLDEYVKKFQKISEAATKEYNLEKSMEQMVADWADVEFTIAPYGDTATYTLSSVDNIQILLDDHIVKTQTMRGSPYIKPFEEQIGQWETQLLLIQEIMDEWLKVQSIWLYLEPIFGSPDIMAQMPEEGRRFTTVDKNWRDIMKAAIVDKHVLKVVEIDRILEKLKKSNELLDLIGKGLNDYLERKRQCFPRFFFLSNSELLEILSETKDPTRVQQHLTKCFEGISKLEFDDDMEVVKMCSAHGEVIPLVKGISTIKARGQVDKWLLELEVQMRESLKREAKRSIEKYDPKSVSDLCDQHPHQALMAANYIYWTSRTQTAIDKGSCALIQEIIEENSDFMSQLSVLILQEPNAVKSQTFANLLLTQGYFITIQENALDKEFCSSDDFEWLSRLRYYVLDGTIKIKIMYSSITYGYEYLSPYNKLVLTPLTERCYQILLIALETHQGGLVSGETATGKTETIKDFAKAVAKQCVSFNCSEEFHYRAFSKFLKGLVSCGAWSCFDEFHRINSQVLSVIAQQILTIQRALHSEQSQLEFEGSVIKISKGCALFVTSESLQTEGMHIPDNLKVLFRPVAMFSPDFAMIAELKLMSSGFKQCKVLAKKIASMVELCDGLLSSQPHYEFGLRSIVAILNSAATLKKEQQDEEEHFIVSLALQRVKYCELLPQDQRMFKDILQHMFFQCPPDPLPDDVLKKAIIEQCIQNELEGTPHFLSKVQQLYDMMDLSDGIMLLGEPFGGKTMAWKILAASLKAVQKNDNLAPACVVLNPKAKRIDQLFGYFELDEWRDGVLAKNFRQFASMPTDQRKWLIFDGPVDSEWIENMNTVLDENKKLCLMSGEIIPLPPNTNLIFEATDVEQASPATISRCGVLYMDPQCLRWNLIVKTWIKCFPKFIPMSIREKLSQMFDRFCHPLLRLLDTFNKVKISEHHLISSLINLFDCHLTKLVDGSELKGMSEHEQTPIFEGIFFFSCIWSIGAFCDTETKHKFNALFRELLTGNLSDTTKSTLNISFEIPELKKPYVLPVPANDSVFDYKLVIGTKPEWSKWDYDANAALPRDIYACQLVIPNPILTKYHFLMTLLVNHHKSFLLMGPPGCGKSTYVKDLIHRKLEADKYASSNLFFTSNTKAHITQNIIMSGLDKRRKGVFGPPLGKHFIVFVDDVNMPEKDDVDSQPPIELLRQLLDHKIWYDSKELVPIKLIEMMVIGTMRPPDGSSYSLSGRFMRHFNVLNVDPIDDDTIITIYSRVVLWHLDTKGFSKEFDPCIEQIVKATLDVHKFTIDSLLPTPYHTHYIFSLKEFSRVICGVLLSVPETMEDLNAMKRLWVHETLRVYYDRLVYDTDRESLLDQVKRICEDKLKVPFNELCSEIRKNNGDEFAEVSESDLRSLLFCDFIDLKNDDKFYKEVGDIGNLRSVTMTLLEKYNSVSRKPMDLVMFDFALEHLCRISRILKQPESHAMLVGVGGSGRQSLSRLASYIAGYEFHEVELAKDDGLKEWRNQMKTMLKKMALSFKHHVLFLYDTQLVNSDFLEDVNNLLLAGEIPLLFNVDERQEIIEQMRNLEKQLDKAWQTDGSGPALFSLFVRCVKENLHVVLAMNPFGDAFKQNIAQFPGMLNCCTINWVQQWPDDALQFVSKSLLSGIGFDGPELEACVDVCKHFHNSSINLSKYVRRKYNLYNYVTPTSFLEMNSLFKSLITEHRKSVEERRKMYQVSLEKLKGAESQVSVMQEEMTAVQPSLLSASREVDEILVQVDKEQIEVSELEKVVKSEDTLVNEKKKTVDAITADLDMEYSESNREFEKSLESLSALSQSELAAVRGSKNPTMSLRLNLEALCLIKSVKPDRVMDSSSGGKMVDDYWGPSKRMVGDPKFLENMLNFDRETVHAKTAKLIREKYLSNPDINPDKAKGSVPALDAVARAVYHWLGAIDLHERVSRNVSTKKESLHKAEKEFEEVQTRLSLKKQQLKDAQERLRSIHDRLQLKKQRKAELENEVELCSRKLERAEQLITGFGGERERWASMSETLGKKYEQLVGDILLAAGTVAYLGIFPKEERKSQIRDWMEKADALHIAYSKDWSLVNVLGNPITIQNWYMNGLLRDDFSTENGIMLSTAKRWVLMVDPQDIANRWIKTTEKNKNLTVLKQSDKDFLRNLENCIQFGSPVLLENVGDSLDPVLEPLLQKQTFQQGGSTCIKLGESTIEYSKDFRMYMTTRLRNPHFPPETTAKIAMVNFSITTDGLIDQLLAIIVARERPELEEERGQVSTQLNENKKSLEDIEGKILNVLYSSKGNILEDENAIKNLSSSKVLANEIIEKQNISEQTFTRINENRAEYLSLTEFAVTLFFCGNILSSVSHMYQYSLSWFINLFCSSLDAADKSELLEERLINVKNHFLQSLFTNTSIGLFEEDKLIYSFILACNLSANRNEIFGSELWQQLITFSNEEEPDEAVISQSCPEALTWLSGKVWSFMHAIERIAQFKDCCQEMQKEIDEWKTLWQMHDPDPNLVSYLRNKSHFEKFVFMIHYRPDKVISLTRRFVIDSLGKTFVDEEPLDIGKAYADSVAATPLIFLLGDSVDPLKYIFKYADDAGYSGKRLRVITMGSGKEEHAKSVIKECVQTGTWVVLLNCHMVPHWMDELEYLVDDLSLESTNADFRLWLTSRPHSGFSVPTLQAGIKIALEEPTTLKTNLIRHLFPDKQFVSTFNYASPEFKKVSFLIAMFHGIINERRYYSQCGWNQDYIFGETDFDLCMLMLNLMITRDSDQKLHLASLKYLITSCVYGSRMEDEMDFELLESLMDVICPDNVLEMDHSLDFEKRYHTQNLQDHETLMTYLNRLPNDVTHLLTRMSEANHHRKDELRGMAFLNKLKNARIVKDICKSQEGIEENDDEEEVLDWQEEERRMKSRILGFLDNLPEVFEIAEDEKDILKLVLNQELQKYNLLLETIRESLEASLQGLEGEILITKDISQLLKSIEDVEIPNCWEQVAYPTMEDLDGFFQDLCNRTAFLRHWQTHGLPSRFWLAALYEPGDFLIAVQYIHSIESGHPYHELGFECRFNLNNEQGILVRDLYLVGASWDNERHCLSESGRDEIFCRMPDVRLVPIRKAEESISQDASNEMSIYACPLFQTSERSGEDNYILDIGLPTDLDSLHWKLGGVALMCQQPKD